MICTLCGRTGHHSAAKCPLQPAYRFMYRVCFVLFTVGMFMAFGLRAAKAGEVSDCTPMVMPNGAGTIAPVSVRGEEGMHQFIFCANPTPMWKGFSCRIFDCMGTDTPRMLYAAARSIKPMEEFDRLWAAHVTWSCAAPPDEPKRLLCVEQKKIGDAELAKHTPTYVRPAWRVKANYAYATRPAFTLANGVVSVQTAKPVIRASVGALCNMTKPVARLPGKDLLAEFSATAGLVTTCEQVAP